MEIKTVRNIQSCPYIINRQVIQVAVVMMDCIFFILRVYRFGYTKRSKYFCQIRILFKSAAVQKVY